jgi:NTP pyrophosphatase (non-canonical NTP hydrolase)
VEARTFREICTENDTYDTDLLEDYQEWVSEVTLPNAQNLMYAGLKLNGEAGEVAELMGKHIRKSGMLVPLDEATTKKLRLELGDVLWYVAHICNILSVDLEDVIYDNVDKLESRIKKDTLHATEKRQDEE